MRLMNGMLVLSMQCKWPATGVAMPQDRCNACFSHVLDTMQVVKVAKLDLVQTMDVQTNIDIEPIFYLQNLLMQ